MLKKSLLHSSHLGYAEIRPFPSGVLVLHAPQHTPQSPPPALVSPVALPWNERVMPRVGIRVGLFEHPVMLLRLQ
jgi:hypothetical protein